MAITYLSGQRVQGSSTGAVTSDYTSDFTSCSTDGNCVGWDSSDTTKFYVDVSDDKYFFNVNASYKSSEFDFDDATYAPNVGTLTTKYVVRWKMKFTALSGSAVYWELGMSNSTGERNATQYFEGLHMRENSYRISVTPNATPEGTTATYMSGTESVTWNTTDTYYFELIRDDASFTLNRYTADDYTTGKTTLTLTITSGTWGATTLTAVMRYFRIITNNSATDTGHVFDVKFWNNVSSTTSDDKATVTDVPVGSEFEQTDDYKSYQFGVATGTTNQSAKDSVSGIDANQAEGGWGVKLYGSHTLVGKKITSITTNMRQTASGYTEQTITLKHYGSSSATLRATGSTMSSDDLTGSFLSKTFTFSNPVTVQAGDYILFTIPADLGTSGAWACEIEDGSPESNAYFATWADGGSFYDQTSRALYYSTTYESDPAWVERGTAI
jgi:hypothetical protein